LQQDLASFASLVGAATERDVQATNDKQAAMGNQKQHTSNKVEAMAEDARKKVSIFFGRHWMIAHPRESCYFVASTTPLWRE